MRLGRWAGVWVCPQVLVGVPGRRRAQLLETMGMGSCQATAGVKDSWESITYIVQRDTVD